MLYIAFSMQRCLMVIEVTEKYMLEFEFFFFLNFNKIY